MQCIAEVQKFKVGGDGKWKFMEESTAELEIQMGTKSVWVCVKNWMSPSAFCLAEQVYLLCLLFAELLYYTAMFEKGEGIGNAQTYI